MQRKLVSNFSRCLIGLIFMSFAHAAFAAPPNPPGHVVPRGYVPAACSQSDTGANAYAANYGYYYSPKKKSWVTNGWCYPVWGNLAATESQIVTIGEAITIYATPNGGSNSAEYAPLTGTISWQHPGKHVSGCGASDLACTFIPFAKGSSEWQWADVKVSMPRTFFINSPGSNCAGIPICAGVTTNAWSFVGTPPCNEQRKRVIDVLMKNKSFSPTSVLATPGSVIKMCNDDPFPQRPYTTDNLNWGGKRLEKGKCISFTVPKRFKGKRANIIFYDAIHTKMRLKVVVEKDAC